MITSYMKSTFNRDYDENFAQQEFSTPFMEKVLARVKEGNAFLAFRPKNKVTIYIDGMKMCNMESSSKYTPIIEARYLPILKSVLGGKKGVSEEEWKKKIGLSICSWGDIYGEIIDNLQMFSKPEVGKVAKMYKLSPLASYGKSNAFLIDIEAKFSYPKANVVSEKEQRIDTVFYNAKTRQLAFIEVKRLVDDRLQKNEKLQMEIVEQLKGYRNLIKNERCEIIKEYNKTLEAYSHIFGLNIDPIDEKQDILLGLLITEYESKDEKLVKSLSEQMKDTEVMDVPVLSIGDAASISSATIEKKWFPSMIKSNNK